MSEEKNQDLIYKEVNEYYGKILKQSTDLKTSACSTNSTPNKLKKILSKIPEEILIKFYGCGNPIPSGIEGLNLLDLGSGSGRDCYVASALVGENGTVTGIDMTDELLEVARKYTKEYTLNVLNYKKENLFFKKGFIEFLEKSGIEKESMDMVISNCVVNLSPNKLQVLKSVYDCLKFGGEFHFSDIYSSRRLPLNVINDKILYGECVSGALYIQDFIRLCHKVGFTDPRELTRSEVTLDTEEMKDLVGEAKFYSITFRLFKLKDLETKCEDYGQYAIYNGTLKDYKNSYQLDDHHLFEKNKPKLVCGNTASMLKDSWLGKHFKVVGDKKVHYGPFDCSNDKKIQTPSKGKGSCC